MMQPRSETPRSATRQSSESLWSCRVIWLTGGSALTIVACIAIGGAQDILAPVCTTAMFGHGWPCFFGWLLLALVSMPWRVRETRILREALHSIGWSIALLWWILAIAFADLFERADLLWCAYLLAGAGIAGWRAFGHRTLLSWCVRRALQTDPLSPGVLAYGGAATDSEARRLDTSGHGRVLHELARLHAPSLWRRLHTQVFGMSGQSRILLEESMDATDARAGAVRQALRTYERDVSSSLELLLGAMECETRLAIALRHHAAIPDFALEFGLRSLAVLESLAIATLRQDTATHLRSFAQILRLAADERLTSDALPRLVDRLFSTNFESAGRALAEASVVVRDPGLEQTIIRLAEAIMLCRHRLFRPARSVLGAIATQDFQQTEATVSARSTGLVASRVERIVHAITSEIELQSTVGHESALEVHTDESQDVVRDREIVARRQGASEFHGRRGLHPRLSSREIYPRDFAQIPAPRLPREIGVGLFAAAIAGCLWITTIWMPVLRPIPGRMHVVHDVPLGGEIASSGVGSAAVAGTEGSRDILLADPEAGVRTLDLPTLRRGREGGPGTPVDGTVLKLGANTDGSALAIFSSRRNGSKCLSVRSPAGDWRPIIGPAELEVGGEDLAAVIDGLPMPLLLLKEGEQRLLAYDADARMLRYAPLEDGADPIQGGFIDWCEGLTETGARCAYLLTDGPSGGVFRVAEGRLAGKFGVEALGKPVAWADIVAVGPAGNGGAVVIERRGRAWTFTSGSSGSWTQLRPGSQGFALDGVEAAAFTHSGSRMWLVRDGIVWTRALGTAGGSPVNPSGWSSCVLPMLEPVKPDERLLIAEAQAEGEIVLLRTAGNDPKRAGYALRIGLSGDKLEASSLLARGDRVLDADASGSNAVLHVLQEAEGLDAPLIHRLDFVELSGSGPARLRTVRSWSVPAEREQELLDQAVLAFGTAGNSALALYGSGTFIRFEPTRDRLLPAIAGAPALFGSALLRPNAIDAAIDALGPSPTAFVLDRDGFIEEVSLAGKNERELVVDSSDSIPRAIAESATHAVSDAEHTLLLHGDSMWEFSSLDASNHWTDRSKELAGAVGAPAVSFDANGKPIAAWKGGAVNPTRVLQNGNILSAVGPKPAELRVGVTNFFVHEAHGQGFNLHLLDGSGRHELLLPAQEEGPPDIFASTIRAKSIDFLSGNKLHSVSIPDGAWRSSSGQSGIQPGYRLGVSEFADGETLLVLPDARAEGPCFAVSAGEQADGLRVLGDGANLRGAVPFVNGIVGLGGNDLLWLDTSGGQPVRLENRSDPAINLAVVEEAVHLDRQILLRGRETLGGKSTIVSYPLEHAQPKKLEGQRFTAIEPGLDTLFALDAGSNRVISLDTSTLSELYSWPLDAGNAALGRNCGGNPAIAINGTIARAERFQLRTLLSSEPIAAGTPVLQSVSFGSAIALFSQDGAWMRDVDPSKGFRKVQGVEGLPELIRFDPDGGFPWIRTGGVWRRLGPAAESIGSIGWTASGVEVRHTGPQASTQPKIAGKIPEAFLPAQPEIGLPRFVESLGTDRALLVGDRGSAVFDTRYHRPIRQDDLLRSIDSGAKVLSRRDGRVRLRLRDGLAVEINRDGERTLFGGQSIRTYLERPEALARLESGQIVDEQGNLVVGSPPAVGGSKVDVTSALSHEGSILRIVNRSVERFLLDSMQVERLPWLKGDAIARCGEKVLLFDRSQKIIRSFEQPATPLIEQVVDWFPTGGRIALLQSSGDIVIESPRGLAKAHVAPAPLPGELLGNIPNSSVSLFRIEPGLFALLDVLTGGRVGGEIRGRDPQIGADAVYLTAVDGKQAIRIDARGNQIQSESFSQVVIRASPAGAILYAAHESPRNYAVVSLDPLTLKTRDTIFTRTARLASGAEQNSSLITRATLNPSRALDSQWVILITTDRLILDGTARASDRQNPLRSALVNVHWVDGRVRIESQDGRRAADIAILDHGRLRLVDNPRLFDPISERSRGLGALRSIRTPILTTVHDGEVRFGKSSLDLKTGWIQAERPIRLEAEDGLSVRFAEGPSLGPIAALPAPAPMMSTTPLQMVDGVLQWLSGGRTIQLGMATSGKRFRAHETTAFAPIADDTSVRIDGFGQMWISKAGDCNPISASQFVRFGVDSDDVLHAAADAERALRVVDLLRNGPDAQEMVDAKPLLKDASRTPGSSGPIEWSWANDESRWTVRDGAGNRCNISPTEQGFRELSDPELVAAGNEAAIRMTAATSSIVVPVTGRSMRWNRIAFDQPTEPPAPVTNLASMAQLGDAWQLVRREGNESIELRHGDRSFEFRALEGRFATTVCHTATAMRDRVVTAASGGKAILLWSLEANGALYDPSVVAPPDGLRVIQLAPGESDDSFVADLTADDGRMRRMAWREGRWFDYEQPPAMATKDARWSWNRKDQLRLDRQHSYRLVEGRKPLLECDQIEFGGGPPGDSLRSMPNGSIHYRGIGGQWFELLDDGMLGMPQPIRTPEPLDHSYMAGDLKFSRWRSTAKDAPDCTLQLNGAFVEIDLRIEAGLVQDIDGWGSDPLLPSQTGEVLVVSPSRKTSRQLSVKQSTLTVGAPSLRHVDIDHPERFDPLVKKRKLGDFTLSEAHEVQFGTLDLGSPSEHGFQIFNPDPRSMVPIGIEADGRIVVSVEGRTVRFDPKRPLSTVAAVESGSTIVRTAWESDGGKALFVAYSREGAELGQERREEIDPKTLRRSALKPLLPSHLHCFGLSTTQFIEVAREGDGLRFDRGGQDSLAMRMLPRTIDDRLAFEHLSVERIELQSGRLHAFAKSSVACYVRNGPKLRLISVQPIKQEPLQVMSLSGGLVARRSKTRSEWTLHLADAQDEKVWPLSSLLGLDRVFVGAASGLLEVSRRWTRIVAVGDGTVITRSPDSPGCRLAGSSIYRNESFLICGQDRFTIGRDGEVARVDSESPVPPLGSAQLRSSSGWALSLPSCDAACEISFDDETLEVRDGALPMDMAIAPPPDSSSVRVVDRHGVEYLSNNSDDWRRHGDAARAYMALAIPGPLRGVDAQGEVSRVVEVRDGASIASFLFPSTPADDLQRIESGVRLESWALGAKVELRVETDGKMRLTRINGAHRYDYLPVERIRACEVGRLAFDVPEQLILAKVPGTTTVDACVVMRSGYEWFDSKAGGNVRAMSRTAPEAEEPEFGPVIRPEWLYGADLDSGVSGAVGETAGTPILWYPFGERLFLVGERNMVWIELGGRWRGRGMN